MSQSIRKVSSVAEAPPLSPLAEEAAWIHPFVKRREIPPTNNGKHINVFHKKWRRYKTNNIYQWLSCWCHYPRITEKILCKTYQCGCETSLVHSVHLVHMNNQTSVWKQNFLLCRPTSPPNLFFVSSLIMTSSPGNLFMGRFLSSAHLSGQTRTLIKNGCI